MLDTQAFGKFLQSVGLKDFVGVPCSYLAPLINYAINENAFIMANNEGDAVAIASGISLCAKDSKQTPPFIPKRQIDIEGNGCSDTSQPPPLFSKAQLGYGVVLMQNSGLSNALSPLTSLNHTFDIPILGFVSLRGERDENGKNTDEPQHELLGVITDKLLQTCEISYMFLEADLSAAKEQVLRALEILDGGKSVFFIVRDKTFQKVDLLYNPLNYTFHNKDKGILHDMHTEESTPKPLSYSTRQEALEIIQSLGFKHKALLCATTGKCGRELYEINDTPNQLYMVGSMGCVSALSLGLSLKTKQKVIAIDGDSALLMRLGTLSTNAYYSKDRDNFCHILLDNQSHDSTGGQFNLSPFVDFVSIALSCGYRHVFRTYDLQSFKKALSYFLSSKEKGAYFIYLRIAKGSKANLGRPKITPKEVRARLMHYIAKQKEEDE